MNMKKLITVGGMMAAVSALAVGCGTQKDSQTTSPSAVNGMTETAPAAQTDDGQGAASGQVTDEVKNATALKDAFQNDFTVGVAVNSASLNDTEDMEFISGNFNSITMENAMKPESVMDREATEKSADGMPEIKTKELDHILSVAQKNGVKLRGHCLVWHNQTPEWFFSKEYEPSKGFVDKETLKTRMEAYIKKVLTYCQENYPGVVYAWDVVNEAVGDDNVYRTKSSWYDVYGDESYITDAFTFARKYADPDVKLFYNDYNEYVPAKRDTILQMLKELREKGLVDGMGMQSHWDMEYPSVGMLENALEEYGKIEGLEIQLTEIDMHNTDDSEEGCQAQAERYKQFFEAIVRAKRTGVANVTNVTFWGLSDDVTWLSSFKGETSYPLLFDEEHKQKPCFTSILETAKQEYQQ